MATLAARPAAPAYDNATSTQAILADALGRILAGRPLPEHLRPAPTTRPRPVSIADGIAGILGGGSRRA